MTSSTVSALTTLALTGEERTQDQGRGEERIEDRGRREGRIEEREQDQEYDDEKATSLLKSKTTLSLVTAGRSSGNARSNFTTVLAVLAEEQGEEGMADLNSGVVKQREDKENRDDEETSEYEAEGARDAGQEDQFLHVCDAVPLVTASSGLVVPVCPKNGSIVKLLLQAGQQDERASERVSERVRG